MEGRKLEHSALFDSFALRLWIYKFAKHFGLCSQCVWSKEVWNFWWTRHAPGRPVHQVSGKQMSVDAEKDIIMKKLKFGFRAFSKSDPRLWNSLLQTLRKCTSLTVICGHLKTRLTSLNHLHKCLIGFFSSAFFFFSFCCSLSVSLWQLYVLRAWLLHEYWIKSYSPLQSPKCHTVLFSLQNVGLSLPQDYDLGLLETLRNWTLIILSNKQQCLANNSGHFSLGGSKWCVHAYVMSLVREEIKCHWAILWPHNWEH